MKKKKTNNFNFKRKNHPETKYVDGIKPPWWKYNKEKKIGWVELTEKSLRHVLYAFLGDDCNINDFYDLENLYNQIKYHELKGDYLSYKEHNLINTATLKTSDIYRTFLYLSNIKNTGKISIKNKSDSFDSHNVILVNFIQELYRNIFSRQELTKLTKKQIASVNSTSKELDDFDKKYTKNVENLLAFRVPDYFHKIDKLLILEWRVDGANNCQFCGIYHPKYWTVSEEKYWDSNYFIEYHYFS